MKRILDSSVSPQSPGPSEKPKQNLLATISSLSNEYRNVKETAPCSESVLQVKNISLNVNLDFIVLLIIFFSVQYEQRWDEHVSGHLNNVPKKIGLKSRFSLIIRNNVHI